MPDPGSWHGFYQSDFQGVWSLLWAPSAFGLFLAARRFSGRALSSGGVAPEASRFVASFSLIFLIETLLDPLATGPLTRILGLSDHEAGSAIAFAFVYLGDFRVFLLLFGVAALAAGRPVPVARAATWALVVPVLGGGLFASARSLWGDLSTSWLWVIYEISFLSLILGFRALWVSAQPVDTATRAFLGFVCLFVASYYALWPLADLLVLCTGLDFGWALRIVPNQLYYGFFVPCIWWRFFSRSFAAR